MAPEVISGSYGKEADMWSLGVLLFTLVSGFFPFYEKSTKAVFDKIKACDWDFKGKTWEKITPECKDLISKLLVHDPKQRLDCQKAINHPWFAEIGKKADEQIEVDPEVMARIIEFKGQSTLKRAAMNMLVQMIS